MLKRIPLNRIHRNPEQPRQHFDVAALEELAASIAENGLQQPITVRPDPNEPGTYMVVAGERRFRAHLILQERGVLDRVLCHVRSMGDEQMHVEAILENLQRVNVSPLEEAVAYDRMIREYGYTPATLAAKLGIKQAHRITDRVRLLGLTDDNRELFRRGVINASQAYAMAVLSPRQQQEMLDIIKSGKAVDWTAACKVADAIQQRDAQIGFFSEEEAPASRAKDEERMSRIEKALEQAAAAVARCFEDGELTIAGRLDPARFEKAAEKAGLLRKHLAQIEAALGHGGTVAQLRMVEATDVAA